MVRRPRTAVLGRTVDLAQTADTDGLAEVDVAGDGGGADVVPERRLLEIEGLPTATGKYMLTSRCSGEEAPSSARS